MGIDFGEHQLKNRIEREQKWLSTMSEWKYTERYINGRENKNAEWLELNSAHTHKIKFMMGWSVEIVIDIYKDLRSLCRQICGSQIFITLNARMCILPITITHATCTFCHNEKLTQQDSENRSQPQWMRNRTRKNVMKKKDENKWQQPTKQTHFDQRSQLLILTTLLNHVS